MHFLWPKCHLYFQNTLPIFFLLPFPIVSWRKYMGKNERKKREEISEYRMKLPFFPYKIKMRQTNKNYLLYAKIWACLKISVQKIKILKIETLLSFKMSHNILFVFNWIVFFVRKFTRWNIFSYLIWTHLLLSTFLNKAPHIKNIEQ